MFADDLMRWSHSSTLMSPSGFMIPKTHFNENRAAAGSAKHQHRELYMQMAKTKSATIRPAMMPPCIIVQWTIKWWKEITTKAPLERLNRRALLKLSAFGRLSWFETEKRGFCKRVWLGPRFRVVIVQKEERQSGERRTFRPVKVELIVGKGAFVCVAPPPPNAHTHTQIRAFLYFSPQPIM